MADFDYGNIVSLERETRRFWKGTTFQFIRYRGGWATVRRFSEQFKFRLNDLRLWAR